MDEVSESQGLFTTLLDSCLVSSSSQSGVRGENGGWRLPAESRFILLSGDALEMDEDALGLGDEELDIFLPLDRTGVEQ